jgi:hypothetical protein
LGLFDRKIEQKSLNRLKYKRQMDNLLGSKPKKDNDLYPVLLRSPIATHASGFLHILLRWEGGLLAPKNASKSDFPDGIRWRKGEGFASCQRGFEGDSILLN